VTDVPLPELAPAQPEPGERSVNIRQGLVPAALAAPLSVAPTYEANDTEFLLRLPYIANYYVRNGDEVTIERSAHAHEPDVRSFLLAPVFAALCHQRGLLPLHASAIATRRGAVAFLGASGAGKSSIVAFLARRGHRILADDICLVDPAAPLHQRVLPVAPWLKLWSETLDALGESSDGLPRIFSEDDKYRYNLQHEQGRTALAEIVLLERGENDARADFEQLTPVHAVRGVLEFTYQFWLIEAMGRMEKYFLRCGQALEGVRVTRMRRPWGFDAMEANLAALEEHLAANS
jgi:hypothetical protein